jgi:hypothetical protein
MTAATSLLDFILNMLKDPQAQAEFRASPEHVLAAHGLAGVSAADIHETLPLVTDNRFVGLNGAHHPGSPPVAPPAGDTGIHAAIRYLDHITRTYRYDGHGAHAHDPGHVNIWAVGDVTQNFGDGHTVTDGPAPGPGGGPGSAFRHPGHDHGDGLHSFGSGAAVPSADGTGSPAAYSGDTGGAHGSAGFHPADPGGTGGPAGPDDWHPHDAHGSPGDSYYGHDSYYGQDTEYGTHDPPEPHLYLDLH